MRHCPILVNQGRASKIHHELKKANDNDKTTVKKERVVCFCTASSSFTKKNVFFGKKLLQAKK
ncbi:hypothetical protein BJD94_11895 [Vibrio vulnificus Env1]|nr:hypothetical protein BJD94_11895 [Vibrio vulnificus Env1]POB66370.1 hypothetical protein CRN59_31315 [Vibrio vulnificus]POC63578.1 hypothetical protein CRN56_21065 [Vibrio vulnificus Env1]